MGNLIVRVVGVVLIIIAIGLGIVAPSYISQGSAAVEALTPLGIAELEQQPPGTDILVEGRISLDMPAHYNIYAAYWLQKPRTTSNNRRSSSTEWDTEALVTPPLVIDLPGGPVRVINEDYNLGTVSNWRDVETEAGGRRIGGLRVGDPVLAIAKIYSNNDGVRLQASVVTVGDKSSYLSDQRVFWWICVGLGAACGLASVILLGANVQWNRKPRRR